MADPVPRVRVPATAKRGDIVEVKTLIAHDMENGQRKDADGKPIPRRIIHRFEASFNGRPVFAAEWGTGISANPYQSFFAKVEQSGSFAFAWMDDDGSIYRATAQITVI
jgi:sulfur-oxidizing protein SoxZ